MMRVLVTALLLRGLRKRSPELFDGELALEHIRAVIAEVAEHDRRAA